MTYTQENRSIVIDTPLGKDVLLVTRFSGTEGISIPFSFDLELLSENPKVDFKKIIGKSVSFSLLLADGDKRFFNGIVSRFSQRRGSGEDGEEESRFSSYTANVVPWFWLLTRTADSRIFQKISVPDIVEKIFKEKGFSDYKMALHESYEANDYCIQYRETDFNFVSRLLEQEGMYYFFEHDEKKHTLVIADSPDEHKPCPKQEKARCQLNSGGRQDEDVITELEWMQEIRIGKYTVNDYNFETPNTDLKVEVSTRHSLGPGEREIYDYPAEYSKRTDGDRLANIRMQEEESQITTITGASVCRAFSSGYRFDLQDYFRADMNEKPYVLTHVSHEASEPVGASGKESEPFYTNHFTCTPFDVPYRPPRITPKPVVEGAQTAIVVGPSGEEIYTDKYGRVKVQFPWDREGKKNENSSCWIRASQPWAGAGWGAMFIPHIGHEVIVDFVEGDPDRPIITGRVYHGTNMPDDTLPDEKTKSVIRSWKDNDIVIEDKDGDKHIHIKQACGNEIIMHEKTPNIEIKQACGNEILMKADVPSIEIKQKCGNSAVMDGKDQYIRFFTRFNNTKFEMGNTPSKKKGGFVKKTDGDWYQEIKGVKVTRTLAAVEEYALSTKATQTVGASSDYFAGIKHSTMVGAEFKLNASKEFAKNAADRDRKSKGHIKYDSEKEIMLIGGPGDQGQLVLDKDGAWLESKGSEIDIDPGSDIQINSKKAINLHASGGDISLEASGDIVLKSSGTHHIKGKLVTPNIKDLG